MTVLQVKTRTLAGERAAVAGLKIDVPPPRLTRRPGAEISSERGPVHVEAFPESPCRFHP